MTQSYDSGPYGGSGPSTGHVVREEAANVGQTAADAGGQVAQTAKEQTRQVVRETGAQARNLMSEAQDELRNQTGTQQKRAAEGLRALGSELHSMAARGDSQQGVAAELAHQAGGRAHQLADWLEQREPGEVLDEVRQFARRNPGAFLAGALAAGVVIGRLTRGLASSGEATGSHRAYPGQSSTASGSMSSGVADVPSRDPYTTTPMPPTPGTPYAPGAGAEASAAETMPLPRQTGQYPGEARP